MIPTQPVPKNVVFQNFNRIYLEKESHMTSCNAIFEKQMVYLSDTISSTTNYLIGKKRVRFIKRMLALLVYKVKTAAYWLIEKKSDISPPTKEKHGLVLTQMDIHRLIKLSITTDFSSRKEPEEKPHIPSEMLRNTKIKVMKWFLRAPINTNIAARKAMAEDYLQTFSIKRIETISATKQVLDHIALEILQNHSFVNISSIHTSPTEHLAEQIFDFAYISADNETKNQIIDSCNLDNPSPTPSTSKKIQLLLCTLFSYPLTRVILGVLLNKVGVRIYEFLSKQIIFLSPIIKKHIGSYISLTRIAQAINSRIPSLISDTISLQINLMRIYLEVNFEWYVISLPFNCSQDISSPHNFSISYAPAFLFSYNWFFSLISTFSLMSLHRGVTSSWDIRVHYEFIKKGEEARIKWLENIKQQMNEAEIARNAVLNLEEPA